MRSPFKTRCLIVAGCVTAAAMVFVPTVLAQSKPATFDAASVRQNVNHIGTCLPEQMEPTPNGFHMTDCPLFVAIGTAYSPTTGEALGFVIGDHRIVGMPDWMTAETYDVDARISEADAEAWKDPTKRKELMQTMLQALLTERCKLAVHREMREKSAYALVVGKNGARLKKSELSDLDALRAKYPGAISIPGGGIFAMAKNAGEHDLYDVPSGTLAMLMSDVVGRTVVDKTGLTGRYDIQLPRMVDPRQDQKANDDSLMPFAVMEELGLKLESQKEQVEVLVIDHVERPSQN